MSRPLILRAEAEDDVRTISHELEAVQSGLGRRFTSALREILDRIEFMPEIYAPLWHDVRAARLKRFQHVTYYIVLAEQVEVLAVLHGARHPSAWQSRV